MPPLKKLYPLAIDLVVPILFSVYPVAFLYAHNAQMLNLQQLRFPLVFAAILALAVFVVLHFLLKVSTKKSEFSTTSLAATLFVLLFWNYSFLFRAITRIASLQHWHILPIVLVIYAHIVCGIHFTNKKAAISTLNKILFAVAALLIGFNAMTIVPEEIRKQRLTSQPAHQRVIDGGDGALEDYPDIYLIILDEYARFDTIKEEFGYDNSIFYQLLKNQGFYIAKKSDVAIPSTTSFIPSILNLSPQIRSTTSDVIESYNNNILFHHFAQYGYSVTILDGWMLVDEQIEDLYPNLTYKSYLTVNGNINDINEFQDIVLQRTIIEPFLSGFRADVANIYYHGNKYFFDFITHHHSNEDTPSFVFAHFMCPHLPFVFTRDGAFLANPTNYWSYKDMGKETLKFLYLEQYIYVTKRISTFIENVLKYSTKKPIIYIVSDHGPREVSAGVKNRVQYHRVLNAVYYPDGDYSDLYDNISPVNTLRVMLNKYFGKNYEMLEERQ